MSVGVRPFIIKTLLRSITHEERWVTIHPSIYMDSYWSILDGKPIFIFYCLKWRREIYQLHLTHGRYSLVRIGNENHRRCAISVVS